MAATRSNVRIHYIPEWAAKLGIERSEIISKTGADKSLVSRWLNKGTLPTERYLVQLAAIFGIEDDDVSSLFRHPDDDWIARWFRNRKSDQLQQVLKLMLEIDSGVRQLRPAEGSATPRRKTGTQG